MPHGASPPGLDTSGDWLADALRNRPAGTVGSLIPPVFPAYARVLHPAVRYAGDDDVEVCWAEVAAYNGRAAHALMQWPGITGAWDFLRDEDQPDVWNDAPPEGHLPVALAARLVDVLGRHTAGAADCRFGLWDGHDFLTGLPAPHRGGGAHLVLPHRTHLLLRGSLRLATANLAPEPREQSANLWWPADRAWCVVTDVDLMSSYVGGSLELVADLLAAPGVEGWPAGPEHPVGFTADRVNPPPT